MGQVAEIWRYPVKSMAGERLQSATITAHGLEHDRLYAFESSGAPPGMLRVSGRERRELLRYTARLVQGQVRVETPGGKVFAVESPELLESLELLEGEASAGAMVNGGTCGSFRLIREETPQTDVRPLSVLSLQTVAKLSAELGFLGPAELDARRFRANLLLDLPGGAFAEDLLVGRVVQIGEARLLLRERTPRCRFVTYEPACPQDEPLFELMKVLDRRHEGRAGVYATVLRGGSLSVGAELLV